MLGEGKKTWGQMTNQSFKAHEKQLQALNESLNTNTSTTELT